MSVDVVHHRIRANGIEHHCVEAGRGPPVVLLHGFPQTWYAWRHQIPVLGRHYRLIVPDLRGHGASDKPAEGYDKRTLARDLLALLRVLGVGRAVVVGHDRGARVGLRFAKDHPHACTGFAALDDIPLRVLSDHLADKMAREPWFFLFHILHGPPESLVTGRTDAWLRFIFRSWMHDPDALSAQDIAIYAQAYGQAGTLRAALADYRARDEDLRDDRADADVRLACPTMALWGESFEAGAGMWDFPAVWREMARDLTTVAVPRCGHLPHEERPGVVNDVLLQFLRGWNG